MRYADLARLHPKMLPARPAEMPLKPQPNCQRSRRAIRHDARQSLPAKSTGGKLPTTNGRQSPSPIHLAGNAAHPAAEQAASQWGNPEYTGLAPVCQRANRPEGKVFPPERNLVPKRPSRTPPHKPIISASQSRASHPKSGITHTLAPTPPKPPADRMPAPLELSPHLPAEID